jgi:hypothetical protein
MVGIRFYVIPDSSLIRSLLVDAVPKKRGPKTDVLEALLKRVDGLERRLKDEKKSNSSNSPKNENGQNAVDDSSNADSQQRLQLDTNIANSSTEGTAVYSPPPIR